jgi:hypothetical protein
MKSQLIDAFFSKFVISLSYRLSHVLKYKAGELL